MPYRIEIRSTRGIGDWQPLDYFEPDFESIEKAEERIAWEKRIDAAPPVVLHYQYRIISVPEKLENRPSAV